MASQTKSGRWSLVVWIVIIALMIIPAVINLAFIIINGVNVPYWDEWDFSVPLVDKLHTGHLSFDDLFAQHNEHRPFFWRLTMLLLGVITHYNNIAEMCFSWFFLCLISCLLLKAYIRYFGITQGAIARFIPVFWLIFGLRQWENLLIGAALCVFMAVLFFILAIYYLESTNKIGWRFVFSIVCGLISSFSFTNGLLVWPIGLIQILLSWWSQRKLSKRLYLQLLGIWFLMGFLIYLAYFVGYIKPASHPDLLYFMRNPLSALGYLITAIGSPLAEQYTAAVMGLFLLILYIYILLHTIRRQSDRSLITPFFISLTLFTFMTVALLVLSRSGFGIGQALSSRYTTFTMIGIVGLYVLILRLEDRFSYLRYFLFGTVITLMAFGIITSDSQAIRVNGKDWHDARIKGAYYLTTVDIQSDENLSSLYPDPKVVRERVEILRKYHLNVFSQPLYDLNKTPLVGSTTQFYVDTVNRRLPAQQDSHFTIDTPIEKTVTIEGWAIDQAAGQAAGGVFINVDGKIDIPTLYGQDRPDVAETYKNSHLRFSGFLASFATSVLEPGQHIMSLKIVTADKNGYYEPEQKIIVNIR